MTTNNRTRYCPNTGVALRHDIGIPNVVIVCHMQERERGFGKRPDGFVYVENKQNLQKFKEFLQQEKNSSRGECYSEILNTEAVQVSEEFLNQLSKHRDDSSRPWIWEVNSKHNGIV